MKNQFYVAQVSISMAPDGRPTIPAVVLLFKLPPYELNQFYVAQVTISMAPDGRPTVPAVVLLFKLPLDELLTQSKALISRGFRKNTPERVGHLSDHEKSILRGPGTHLHGSRRPANCPCSGFTLQATALRVKSAPTQAI